MPVPKQARSQATRARIVEAAAQALARHGFQKASTPFIAGLAEVSQGALFKHFPTKAALLAACLERLLGSFILDFRADVAARLGPARSLKERVAVAVGALWRCFRRTEMHAVFEVYVAARTDEELARALAPILDGHRGNILAEARGLFPELGAADDFGAVVDAVVYAMQGVVLGLFAPDGADDASHVAFFERLALRELEAVAPGGAP
jgi:AcrR family transcriptional regulator